MYTREHVGEFAGDLLVFAIGLLREHPVKRMQVPARVRRVDQDRSTELIDFAQVGHERVVIKLVAQIIVGFHRERLTGRDARRPGVIDEPIQIAEGRTSKVKSVDQRHAVEPF